MTAQPKQCLFQIHSGASLNIPISLYSSIVPRFRQEKRHRIDMEDVYLFVFLAKENMQQTQLARNAPGQPVSFSCP